MGLTGRIGQKSELTRVYYQCVKPSESYFPKIKLLLKKKLIIVIILDKITLISKGLSKSSTDYPCFWPITQTFHFATSNKNSVSMQHTLYFFLGFLISLLRLRVNPLFFSIWRRQKCKLCPTKIHYANHKHHKDNYLVIDVTFPFKSFWGCKNWRSGSTKPTIFP